MPELIVYATASDAELLRAWLNAERGIAWIVKSDEHEHLYTWRAQLAIDRLQEQEYAIWHMASGPLNIPSGSLDVPDATVPDPFAGWSQRLDHAGATRPWFGANLPGPYTFRFSEKGREAPNSVGRSGFYWALDRFKTIGNPAHPEAKRWWFRLKRFLAKHAVMTPWPGPEPSRQKAFVFPDALAKWRAGRPRDVNP